MHNNFVFNHLSLPAADKDSGRALLTDTLRGMLAYGDYGDTYAIYSDGKAELVDIEIVAGFKYRDFISELGEIGEQDLQAALLEISDKTPMLDHLVDEQIEAISLSAFYFPDEAYTTTIDILGVAWELDAVLLSLNTAEQWAASEIKFAQHSSEPMTGYSYINNISTKEHGVSFNARRQLLSQKSLREMFPICKFSEGFLQWHSNLTLLLRTKVNDKIRLAVGKNFEGGKPLFETLSNADGMREIRFSNTEGGAVRIIFKGISNNNQVILCGFIKKSDNEGYEQAIADAKRLLKEMAPEKK